MIREHPKQIICAVRGGPESRETVTKAIDMALETGARLTFLHVMDAEFLEHATIGTLSVVYRELEEMGKFAMLILCDRATRRGVETVDYIIREGNIQKQILQFAKETNAEIMVVGRPIRSPGSNAFREEEIDEFAVDLAKMGDIQILLVSPA
jgi:nucleotide-binding universal stress UspA family protein